MPYIAGLDRFLGPGLSEATTGGVALQTATQMGIMPKALLFPEHIDTLAASGLILADIWLKTRVVTVDQLEKGFLEYVHDGQQIELHEDGTVIVKEQTMDRLYAQRKLASLALVALLLAGCGGGQVAPTPIPSATPVPRLDAKRVLFVIFPGYEENEYGKPRAVLEERGGTVEVASTSLDAVSGSEGMQVRPDLLLSAVRTADYDAVVFIGGGHYQKDNSDALRIAREAASAGKIVAAICVAPVTLAKAGLLKGKRVTTSNPSAEFDDAIYTGATVECDGLIITALGPRASQEFGEAIAAALAE